MTRILHVLDHSLPLHSGYTFRTRAILRAQQAMGWDVSGITGLRHSAAGPECETIDELCFHRTPARALPGTPVLRELAEISLLADAIAARVRAEKPDILHAHSPVLGAMAAQRIARRFNIPMVYEIRAFWEDAAVSHGTTSAGSARYRATRWLEDRAIAEASAIIVICEGLRADLMARGVPGAKITVVPNGVDLDLFGSPPAADASLAQSLNLIGCDVIGFIGSFYDYEGIDDLIAAMPALIAARPQTRLLLVGGGPEEERLRAQAAQSPVAEAIRFVGRVPHADVERYYSLIDVLCYPRKAMRLTELVTPLKPLEAMAQRRLVAASSIGGHRELIRDGVTGTLFAPGQPAEIARALSTLLADRSGWDQMREAGECFVRSERDWSRNVARYAPVYARLVADRTSRRKAA